MGHAAGRQAPSIHRTGPFRAAHSGVRALAAAARDRPLFWLAAPPTQPQVPALEAHSHKLQPPAQQAAAPRQDAAKAHTRQALEVQQAADKKRL